jgi:hypothetical protein
VRTYEPPAQRQESGNRGVTQQWMTSHLATEQSNATMEDWLPGSRAAHQMNPVHLSHLVFLRSSLMVSFLQVFQLKGVKGSEIYTLGDIDKGFCN